MLVGGSWHQGAGAGGDHDILRQPDPAGLCLDPPTDARDGLPFPHDLLGPEVDDEAVAVQEVQSQQSLVRYAGDEDVMLE